MINAIQTNTATISARVARRLLRFRLGMFVVSVPLIDRPVSLF